MRHGAVWARVALVILMGFVPCADAFAQAPDPAPPPASTPQPDAVPGANLQPAAPPATTQPPPVATQPPPVATQPPPVATPPPPARVETRRPRAEKPHAAKPANRSERRRRTPVSPRPRPTPVPTARPSVVRFDTATAATRSRPTHKASRNRDALLIGGALAMLAVAASTVLLVAQATRLERSLRAG